MRGISDPFAPIYETRKSDAIKLSWIELGWVDLILEDDSLEMTRGE